jgi:hypothetical protein
MERLRLRLRLGLILHTRICARINDRNITPGWEPEMVPASSLRSYHTHEQSDPGTTPLSYHSLPWSIWSHEGCMKQKKFTTPPSTAPSDGAFLTMRRSPRRRGNAIYIYIYIHTHMGP